MDVGSYGIIALKLNLSPHSTRLDNQFASLFRINLACSCNFLQYLSQVYDEELKDFEEDLWEDMAKERLKSNETVRYELIFYLW